MRCFGRLCADMYIKKGIVGYGACGPAGRLTDAPDTRCGRLLECQNEATRGFHEFQGPEIKDQGRTGGGVP